MFIYPPLLYSSTHSSLHQSITNPFVHLPVHPYISIYLYPSTPCIHPSIHTTHPPIYHPTIHVSLCLFIHHMHPSINPLPIEPYTSLYLYPSTHASIHQFGTHPSILPFSHTCLSLSLSTHSSINSSSFTYTSILIQPSMHQSITDPTAHISLFLSIGTRIYLSLSLYFHSSIHAHILIFHFLTHQPKETPDELRSRGRRHPRPPLLLNRPIRRLPDVLLQDQALRQDQKP